VDAVVAANGAAVTPLSDFAADQGAGLTRFAYLLCGDRGLAEDLVQETYLALYRRFGDTLTVAAPVAYARRTIVNAHISRSRSRAAHEIVSANLPDAAAERHDETDQDAMWRLLGTLPARQRAVLVLRFYADLSEAEIAATLGCRPGTVRSLATRAFATLRAHPAFAEEHQR
jgi:RNA polymerase sigma-70 factor (sigma-E family)